MIYNIGEQMKIHNADCLTWMKAQPDQSIDVCVSSPPYNIGIAYNTYGDKMTASDYLDWQKDVWNEVCRILKPDGHLFLNIASTKADPYMPYDVARNVPWVLQNNIIWAKAVEVDGYVKGHSTPTTSTRYLQNGWEHLFHFTKSGDTDIDLEWSGVPYSPTGTPERNAKRTGRRWRPTTTCWHYTYKTANQHNSLQLKGKQKHPAVFPESLVEKCIKVSGLKSGIVFDPFVGTGTTMLVANKLGLDYVGTDIDPDYVEFANSRLNTNFNNLFTTMENK
jgi:site-specific DNA-methyltransferase (adenine-specific)